VWEEVYARTLRASYNAKESGGMGGRAMRLMSGRGVGECGSGRRSYGGCVISEVGSNASSMGQLLDMPLKKSPVSTQNRVKIVEALNPNADARLALAPRHLRVTGRIEFGKGRTFLNCSSFFSHQDRLE